MYCVLVFKNNKVRTVPHSEDLRFTGTAFRRYPNCFSFTLWALIRPCFKTDDSKGDDDTVFQVRTRGEYDHPSDGQTARRRFFKGAQREEFREMTKTKLPNELK